MDNRLENVINVFSYSKPAISSWVSVASGLVQSAEMDHPAA